MKSFQNRQIDLMTRFAIEAIAALVVISLVFNAIAPPAWAIDYGKRNLIENDFSNQDLTDSIFDHANLRGSDFSHANLQGVRFLPLI